MRNYQKVFSVREKSHTEFFKTRLGLYTVAFLLSLMAMFVLVGLHQPIRSYAATGQTVTCTTQEQLEAALANASTDEKNPTIIAIGANLEVEGQSNTPSLTVAAGTFVQLQSVSGKNYTLTQKTKFSNREITGMLDVRGSLTLSKITLDANYNGRVVLVENGGVLTLNDGATLTHGIEIGYRCAQGLGVYVRNGSKISYGTLIMNKGSKITQCQTQGKASQKTQGIGLYVGTYGQVQINGGEISENLDIGAQSAASSCASGAGVYIENNVTFVMSSGKITNNRAYGGGGGIYMLGSNKSSTVTIEGNAEISNNISTLPEIASNYQDAAGGGIHMEGGILYLKDQMVLANNVVQTDVQSNYSGCGGGIFVAAGQVYMEGGSIQGNKTESLIQSSTDTDDFHILNGGGVYVKKGTFEMSGGTISQNTAGVAYAGSVNSGNGGGICLEFEASESGAKNGTVILSGGVIEDNLAENHGSGMYVESKIAMTVNKNRDDERQIEVTGNSILQLGQNPIIWGNGSEDLYLHISNTDTVFMNIDSKLDSEAKIGIVTGFAENVDQSKVILAKPSAQYALRNSDADAFVYEGDEEKELLLDENGYFILSDSLAQNREDLSEAEVTIDNVTYNAQAQTPDVTVIYQGKTLVKGTDYSALYLDNTNAGTAQVVINGRGAYKGTIEKTFEILPYNVAGELLTISEIGDKYYTGTALCPTVTAYMRESKLTAKSEDEQDYDYEVTYGENIAAGTGTVTITGHGNYTGSKTVSFNILSDDSVQIVMSEAELREVLAQTATSHPTKIVLGADIVLTEEICLENDTDLSLIGNGFTLSMANKNLADSENLTHAMFVLKNAKLDICDIQLSGENKSRIFYVDANSELTVQADVTLTKGMAASSSDARFGGQCIYNKGKVDFAGTIEKSYNGYYGVIYNSGVFSMSEGSRIQNVKSTMGGAIYNAETGIYTMTGTKIVNSSGASGVGAAISNFGQMNMDAVLVQGCDCSVSAIYNGGTLNMKNSQVMNNKNSSILQLGQSGGTLYQKSGTFTMTDSQVMNNVTCTGGGVFVDGGVFIMEGGSSAISENMALYEILSSTNVNDFGNGGGVFINNGQFEMRAGSIEKNSATYQNVAGQTLDINGVGGGVFINGGTFTMKGGRLAQNEAVDEQTTGVYVSHALLGSSVKDKSVFQMSGSADIQDIIYLSDGYSIELLDAISDTVSYQIIQEDTDIGAAVAVYRELETGEDEFLQDTDAQHFLSQGTKKQYEVVQEDRKIALAKQNLSDCTVTLTQSDYAYTGKKIVPDVEIRDIDGNLIREYDVVGNNINVGSATATIQGDGYTTTGSVSVSYKIIAREISAKGMTTSLSKSIYQYTGSAIVPDVTVKNGTTVLKVGSDYIVTAANNVKVGTAQVTISGKGNYTGTVTKTFTIKKKQTITASSYKKAYSNAAFVLNAKTDGDGKLSYSSNNEKVATVSSAGKVTLKGIGTAKITVTAASTTTCLSASKTITITVIKGTQTCSAPTSYTKTYGEKAFSLQAKLTAGNGKLTYKSADTNIVKVSNSGKVTITGCGRTKITVTAAETSLYNAVSKSIVITVAPQKLALSSVKNQKGQKIAVAWKKDTKVSGYQIQYATDKNFTKNVKTSTITKNTTVSKVLTGLKKGTTYYVRIRSYKLVDGKALYGAYCTGKSVKVTK